MPCALYKAALQTLGAGGTQVVYGAASGEPPLLAGQQLMGQVQSVRGYNVFAETDRFAEYVGELFGYIQASKLQLPIETYPLAEVQTAHQDLESRRTQGKVVLVF
jgi:NADPH:quinone reductase